MGNSKSVHKDRADIQDVTTDKTESLSESADEEVLEINECSAAALEKEQFVSTVCCAHRCREETETPLCGSESDDCRYIKIKELTLDKLPLELREQSLLHYLKVQEKLVVRLKVTKLSPSRKLQQVTNEKIDSETGTGYVWPSSDKLDIYQTCPLKNCCVNDGQSHKAYGGLIVYTNKHVVHDNFEAENCIVDFFYNDFSPGKLNRPPTSQVNSQSENTKEPGDAPMSPPTCEMDFADQGSHGTKARLIDTERIPTCNNTAGENDEVDIMSVTRTHTSGRGVGNGSLLTSSGPTGGLNHNFISREAETCEWENNMSQISADIRKDVALPAKGNNGEEAPVLGADDAESLASKGNSSSIVCCKELQADHGIKTMDIRLRSDETTRISSNVSVKNDQSALLDLNCQSWQNSHLAIASVRDEISKDISCQDISEDIKKAQGYCLRENKNNKDLVGMRLIFHNPQLFHLVSQFSSQRLSCWKKIPSDLKWKMKQHAIVISHPHGRPKQISFGRLISLEKMDTMGRKATTYDATTCPGSSGAPVVTGYYPERPFTHSRKAKYKDNIGATGTEEQKDAILIKYVNKSISY